MRKEWHVGALFILYEGACFAIEMHCLKTRHDLPVATGHLSRSC
jgi:hypothetical protein